jgi:hypothetical protein
MTDNWTEQLHCPKCGKTGLASISQDGTNMPIVEAVPAGFDVVSTRLGSDFHCSTCEIVVKP